MEENKKSLKMPIIILVVVLVALLVWAVIYVTNNNKPKNIFLGAIDKVFSASETKTEEIKTVNATLGLGININSQDATIAKIAGYLNKAKITLNSQMDLEQEKEFVKLGLDYENSKVLDAKISYKNQDNNIYAKVEELFDKSFAIEADEEIKEVFKTIFEEAKALSKEDNQNSKKAIDILKDSITSRLKDEYFSQENVEIDIEGEKVNTRKSTLALTPAQLKEVLTGIASDLKNSEEFINCFDELDREEIKDALNNIETFVKDIDTDTSEQDKLYINIYTKGSNKEFVKFEIVVVDDEDELVIGIVKTDTENYKVLANQKIDGEISELLNCIITVKNVNDTTTDLTVKVNVEELGEVTVNLQVSYIINEPIESFETTNSVNIEELTEADQQKIMTNLEGMKIYKIVQDIIKEFSTSMMNQYDYDADTSYEFNY